METRTFSNDFMRTREVTPLILSMSLPMVFSMLVNSLYNIVDSYFVAKISEDAMTALSLVFPIQNLVHSIAVGFGVGINAVIAFHSGAGNGENADKAASQGLFLAVIHSLVLTVCCIAIMPAFLSSFTSSEDIVSMGVRYSTVVFSFTLINLPGITFEKIFQAVFIKILIAYIFSFDRLFPFQIINIFIQRPPVSRYCMGTLFSDTRKFIV